MYELRFFVPGRVPTLNDLLRMKAASKKAYNGTKRRWDKRVADAAFYRWLADRTPRLPPGPALIELHVLEPDARRDPDNVAAAARKFIHDGLVKAKLIPGDGWGHVHPVLLSCLAIDSRGPGIHVRVVWGATLGQARAYCGCGSSPLTHLQENEAALSIGGGPVLDFEPGATRKREQHEQGSGSDGRGD